MTKYLEEPTSHNDQTDTESLLQRKAPAHPDLSLSSGSSSSITNKSAQLEMIVLTPEKIFPEEDKEKKEPKDICGDLVTLKQNNWAWAVAKDEEKGSRGNVEVNVTQLLPEDAVCSSNLYRDLIRGRRVQIKDLVLTPLAETISDKNAQIEHGEELSKQLNQLFSPELTALLLKSYSQDILYLPKNILEHATSNLNLFARAEYSNLMYYVDTPNGKEIHLEMKCSQIELANPKEKVVRYRPLSGTLTIEFVLRPEGFTLESTQTDNPILAKLIQGAYVPDDADEIGQIYAHAKMGPQSLYGGHTKNPGPSPQYKTQQQISATSPAIIPTDAAEARQPLVRVEVEKTKDNLAKSLALTALGGFGLVLGAIVVAAVVVIAAPAVVTAAAIIALPTAAIVAIGVGVGVVAVGAAALVGGVVGTIACGIKALWSRNDKPHDIAVVDRRAEVPNPVPLPRSRESSVDNAPTVPVFGLGVRSPTPPKATADPTATTAPVSAPLLPQDADTNANTAESESASDVSRAPSQGSPGGTHR